MNKYLVLDIGGSFVKSAIVDSSGGLENKSVVPTPTQYEDMLQLIVSLVTPEANAIVCSVPGVYDKELDHVLFVPNLYMLIGKKLAKDIATITKLPAYVENDANLAALGEYHYGFELEQKPASMILLTLGTGVGGGVVLNGELFTGRYTLFEPGHISIVAEGRLCGCGKRGCLEKYCSVSAILADYAEASGYKDPVTVHDVVEKLATGDFGAFAAFDMFALHLSHAIASMINLYTPESLRIGGGLSELATHYMPRVDELLPELIFPAYRDITSVEIARLKNDAALLGGAKLRQLGK